MPVVSETTFITSRLYRTEVSTADILYHPCIPFYKGVPAPCKNLAKEVGTILDSLSRKEGDILSKTTLTDVLTLVSTTLRGNYNCPSPISHNTVRTLGLQGVFIPPVSRNIYPGHIQQTTLKIIILLYDTWCCSPTITKATTSKHLWCDRISFSSCWWSTEAGAVSRLKAQIILMTTPQADTCCVSGVARGVAPHPGPAAVTSRDLFQPNTSLHPSSTPASQPGQGGMTVPCTSTWVLWWLMVARCTRGRRRAG